ncbi:MAG: hypothetical protein IKQ41_02010 [Clostridia bacterium]|nr:hypothetical protein [Clostridia bacterium]
MTFARSGLRSAWIAVLLLALVMLLGTAALAEDNDPVNFSIQVTPETMTAPGEVSVSLRVSNTSDEDMIAPVSLFDPAGNAVTTFGDGGSYLLKSGDSKSWEGKWNVTQAQLDAGSIAYTLRYHLEDETGTLVEFSRQAVARLEFTGERINLSVTRTINPQVVRSGGKATVTYELYNSGNVDLTDVRVQEKIARNAKTVKSLPVGERATVSFESRIGSADLTSNASITFKAVGTSKTLTQQVEDALIPLAKPNLKIELTAPENGVNVGEAAKLVITFINAGNVSYSNVTVTEAKRGEILTNLSIPAGATVTEEKEFILMEPTDFKVTATLPDNTGETKTLTSNEVRVGVYDPEKQLLLTLNLTADQETVPSAPADVRFHLTVTNNSNIKAEKITISHGTKFIYTIDALEPGASVTLDRDVRISQAGQFRFTASLKDSLNNTVTFDSNTIRISYFTPTAAPTQPVIVTVAPPVKVTAVPADPMLSQGRSWLFTGGAAIAGLFGLTFLLFLVSTIVRLIKKHKSNTAYDHLELAERRDYTEPSDEDDEEVAFEEETVTTNEPEETVSLSREEKRKEAELPHEKLLNSMDQTVVIDSMDAPAADDEGGYRVSRTQEAAPEEAKAADPDAGQPKSAIGTPKRAQLSEASLNRDEETIAVPKAPRRRRNARKEDGE